MNIEKKKKEEKHSGGKWGKKTLGVNSGLCVEGGGADEEVLLFLDQLRRSELSSSEWC